MAQSRHDSRYDGMSLIKVDLLRTDLVVKEDLDREAIIQGLSGPNESNIVTWLEKLISWTSNDHLATCLRSMRLTPALLKLLEHENEDIVDLAASTMSYLSGRSAAGPYTRLWSFTAHYAAESPSSKLVTLPIMEPSYSSGAGLGWKTWNAAVVLVDFLGSQLETFRDKEVLELGCGTGLSGIFCAKFGAKSVLMTDFNQTVLETVTENAKLNGLPNVSIKRLDWHDLLKDEGEAASTSDGRANSIQTDENVSPALQQLTLDSASTDTFSGLEKIGTFNTIIGSDIVYDPEHAEIVPKVLNRLLAHNDEARAYIAVGPRPEAARFMHIMANDFDFEMVVRKELNYIDAEGENLHHDMLVYKRRM